MTVQEASNELFVWFENNDGFEINRDVKKIVPIFESEEETVITFKIALEKLEEMQLLASKDYGDKKYYILEKPMDSFQQNVELGPWTAKFMAQELNDFCDLLEDESDKCSVSAIVEKDIRNLVHIIQWYRQRVIEKETIISAVAAEHPDILPNLPPDSPDNPEESSHSE